MSEAGPPRLHERPWLWLGAFGGLAAVAALVVVVLATRGDGDGDGARPGEDVGAVVVTPAGGELPRLAPITIAFAEPPAQADAARLVSFEPAAEGAFVWADDRTLLFQPAFPGWQRGRRYELRVDAAAAGLANDHTQAFTVEGRLEVAYVIPADGDEEVPAEAQILVQFNRSVAALTVLQEGPARAVLAFEPPLAGSGEWLNSSLYRFTPSDLQPSAQYRVRVPAGLTSAADGVLGRDFEWSFATSRPALASSDPADNTRFVEPSRAVVLTFNQPMDRASVEAGVRLRDGAGGEIAGAFAWSEDDAVATFTPGGPLAVSTEHELEVPAGLRGARGGESRSRRLVRFATVDPPALVASFPGAGERDASRFGIQLEFNNPMDVESIEGRIAVSGIDPEDVLLFPFNDDRGVSLSVALEPSTEYAVRIAEGVRDRAGQPLPAASFSFTTGSLPESVVFAVPGQFATYSAAADAVLFFHATNTAAAELRLYRLSEAEARRLLREGFIDDRFRPAGDPIRAWTEEVAGQRDVPLLVSTSLGAGEPLPKGDYYVTAGRGDYRTRLAFSVVDTVLVAKLALDELLVWALDYETGEPLAGVAVTADGPGLPAEAQARTDGDGLARLGVQTQLDVGFNERYYVLRLDSGGRRGITSTRWQQGSEPWQLNLPVDFFPRELVGHVYSDRPIYRPGETVFYKGVVRRDDDARYRIPEADPGVGLSIRDPQYNELTSSPVMLNDLGTFAGEFVIPDDAPTGVYSLQLGGGVLDSFFAGTTFTVAEFRVPEFRIEVATTRVDYVDGDAIDVEAAASFFFGGPVAGAPVEWAVLSSATSIRVEGYERYSFADFDAFRFDEFRRPLRAEGSAETDAAGVARFAVAAVLEGSEGAQEFQVSATVTDENAQAVASSTTLRVHPAAYYAGIKPESYIATAGEPAGVSLVTVDVEGAIAPNRPVTVRIFQREWVTTKEQTAGGGRIYRSEPVDTALEVRTATTDEAGEARIEYVPPRAGSYRLVAESTDEQGRVARAPRSCG